ncbi:MAG: tRNA pseudouridine(55) synthase TruB [Pseudomonadota bacterium]
MARRKKGNPIHGWLVLDKPQDITSTTAVNKIKRLLNAQKAGHAGTLDPLATGILPIALGEATKTVPYLMDSEKEYSFTVSWGVETNTDDQEGEPTQTSQIRPKEQDIVELLPRFTGKIDQVPPKFSAIKLDGERAYKRARDNEDFALKPRQVNIKQLRCLTTQQEHSSFAITCGKGTYIRSLARDMGRILGCYGHISQLRRTRVGPFAEKHTVTLEKILEKAKNISHSAPNQNTDFVQDLEHTLHLLPAQAALDDIPAITVAKPQAQRLKQGQSALITGQNAPISEDLVYVLSEGKLIAIGKIEKGQVVPSRVFCI